MKFSFKKAASAALAMVVALGFAPVFNGINVKAAGVSQGLQKGELINKVDFGTEERTLTAADEGVGIWLRLDDTKTGVTSELKKEDGVMTVVKSHDPATSDRADSRFIIVPEEKRALTADKVTVVEFDAWFEQGALTPNSGNSWTFFVVCPADTAGGTDLLARLAVDAASTRAMQNANLGGNIEKEAVSAKVWHKFTLYIDTKAALYDLYIDGVLVFEAAKFNAEIPSGNTIGSLLFNGGKNGVSKIKEVAVYTTVAASAGTPAIETTATPAPTTAPSTGTDVPPATSTGDKINPVTGDSGNLLFVVLLGGALITLFVIRNKKVIRG